MPSCAVYGCMNHTRKTKGKNIKYYSFPKNEELAKSWVHACKRKDKINLNNARVCSHHFHESSYDVPLRQRLLNYTPKNSRNLKADAIPTENLHSHGEGIKKRASNDKTQAKSLNHQNEVVGLGKTRAKKQNFQTEVVARKTRAKSGNRPTEVVAFRKTRGRSQNRQTKVVNHRKTRAKSLNHRTQAVCPRKTLAKSRNRQTEAVSLHLEILKPEKVDTLGLESNTTALESAVTLQLEVQYLRNRLLILERENCELKLRNEELSKANREILRKLDTVNSIAPNVLF